MNIILLEHIDDLGTVGQTVKVKDGYARNFLLPRKLACLATDKNMNFYRTLIEAKKRKLERLKGSAEQLAQQLATADLVFVRKSKDQEARLFGSVTNADIAAALAQQGFDIEKKRIVLSEAIKKMGEYTASIRVHPEVVAQVKVSVVPEETASDADGK
jgi:large subunit ribosomal protein L9